MSENYEKYKNIVNKPQEWAKAGFDVIKDWSPKGKGGKIGRFGAGVVSFNLYLLMRLITRVGFDNPIIKRWSGKYSNVKVDQENNFKKFVTNTLVSNPTASALLTYYMVLLSFVGAGNVAYDNQDEIKQFVKEWKQSDKDDVLIEGVVDDTIKDDVAADDEKLDKQEETFAAYKENLESLTPLLIAQLIAAEGVNINDQGLHEPYKDSKGIWTIGFGSTHLKDGTRVTKDTPPITGDEAYELARWHLEEKETLFDMYCYGVFDKRLKPRNTGEAFGLASIIYNSGTKFIEDVNDRNHKERFETLRQKYKEYGADISDSLVYDVFQKYPIRNKADFGKAWIDSNDPKDMGDAIGLYMADGAGMHWRRWLEAGLITGNIDPSDLLNCPIKGMYDFYVYIKGGRKKKKDDKFALWQKTDEGLTPKIETYAIFKEWLKNPQTRDKKGRIVNMSSKRVKDFLPQDIVQQSFVEESEINANNKIENKKSKVVAFYNGIEKLKNKQKQNDIVYPIDGKVYL